MQQTNIHFNNHESTHLSRFFACVCVVISRVSCVYVGLVRVVRDPQQRARETPAGAPPLVVSAITTRATA